MARARVAVVADDEDFRVLLVLWLSSSYETVGFRTPDALLECVELVKPELIVRNLSWSGARELEVLRPLRAVESCAMVPVLLLDWDREGACGERAEFLKKPFPRRALCDAVKRLLAPAVAAG